MSEPHLSHTDGYTDGYSMGYAGYHQAAQQQVYGLGQHEGYGGGVVPEQYGIGGQYRGEYAAAASVP